MTCEVAVMNRRGIALATDSAVTLGEGEKIYHSAEKLFPLSLAAPVGIMTYGAADFMGVPWTGVSSRRSSNTRKTSSASSRGPSRYSRNRPSVQNSARW